MASVRLTGLSPEREALERGHASAIQLRESAFAISRIRLVECWKSTQVPSVRLVFMRFLCAAGTVVRGRILTLPLLAYLDRRGRV